MRYVVKRQHRMDYVTAHREHRPVGSGVQEAACKTLVTDRMRRSGMSWNQEGGQGILTLRTLDQSGRWSAGWAELRKRLGRSFVVDDNTSRQSPKRAAA
jgi:hypothetical protein